MLPDGFLVFINEHRLFAHTDRVLLAVSGGIDSMVLASLMHRIGYSFSMAHVNFGLRGADSDADAAFVENMAHSYGVPFHLISFDTTSEAARRGESIQVTARQLRYEWFQTVQHQHGYVAVATAHHLNDVLETMLFNLTRGTGLAGLRGMPFDSHSTTSSLLPADLRIVRPLWFATRAAIDEYATENHLHWREDSSNESDKYSRNKIRHQVIPVLEQINPSLLQTISRTLNQLRATETILQADIAASFSQCVQHTREGLIIDITALANYSEPLFRLGEWLRPYGFTSDVLAQCWHSVDPARNVPAQHTQVFLAPAFRLLVDRAKLWMLPHRSEPASPIQLASLPTEPVRLDLDAQLSFQLINRDAWDSQWPSDASVAILDATSLPFPWTIRPWRNGDRFKPLGMKGTRLVSDFLADAKLPLRERERVWVLESEGQIGWIVGLRIADTSRITDKTQQLISITRQVTALNCK